MGHEVHVVTYGDGSGPLDPSIRVHRIRRLEAIRVERPGPSVGKLAVLDPLLTLRLRGVIRRHAFDVIHAHHYEGLLVAVASGARSSAPVVYDAHTVLESELPAYGAWMRVIPARTLGRFVDRWLPGRARFVVAASDPLRTHLLSSGAVKPDRMAVVGNGVELEHFPVIGTPVEPEPDAGVLVYAGNLAPYQGTEHLLEAFRTVLAQRPRARLLVLTNSASDDFQSHARDLGIRDGIELRSVDFEALPRELAKAHVVLNPRPRCDGVPQKNLNYMASASALVAFTGSLHPCRNGESGVGVSTVSGAALGRAVLDLLDRPDERIRLGREARATLEREFTWNHQAEHLTEIYERIIATRPITP